MGCVSSKLIRKELEREILCGVNGEYFPNHVVSLTSSTYGALRLEKSDSPKSLKKAKEAGEDEDKKKSPLRKEREEEEEEEEEETEVINAWELMGDLEEETMAISIRGKNSPKPQGRSPFKRINKVGSPKTVKKLTMGKENRVTEQCNSNVGAKATYFTPKRVSKSWDFPEKVMDSSSVSSTRRKSLSPLFDPALVEAYEKELSQEQEQIKKIISQTPSSNARAMKSSRRFDCHLDEFENKCPPGGEDSVVVYTTTLRGIRKTFEECNTARSILESHQIQMYERDVSMDSGFKEELRKLMGGAKELFRIPLVFVKGRLIGGADEISKLEEEGRLANLLHQIPRNSGCVCKGCGGIRFVMCSDCNGSCKVLDEGHHKGTVRCGECNENGLIHCPLCC